jgi:hypothetical protein
LVPGRVLSAARDPEPTWPQPVEPGPTGTAGPLARETATRATVRWPRVVSRSAARTARRLECPARETIHGGVESMGGLVVAVSLSPTHSVAKRNQPAIRLLAGLGVEGDVHAGATVRHRYHVRRNPGAPNRCQVHLFQAELHDELRKAGFDLGPGQMGENVTTRGVDLLTLPTGTRLWLGGRPCSR